MKFELFILISRLWFIERNDSVVGIDILLMMVKLGNDVYNLMKKKLKKKIYWLYVYYKINIFGDIIIWLV